MTLTCDTPEARSHVRHLLAAGEILDTPVSTVCICSKLDVPPAGLNSLFTACPIDGFLGTEVARAIREQFGIGAEEDLAEGLYVRGILNEAETRWMQE